MAERLGKRIQRMRGEERTREIRRVVSEWRSSGKSKLEFCEDAEISANALTRWERELARSRRAQPEAPTLVEVTPSRPASPKALELTLPGGARVHVPAGFDEADLGRLLRVVHATC